MQRAYAAFFIQAKRLAQFTDSMRALHKKAMSWGDFKKTRGN